MIFIGLIVLVLLYALYSVITILKEDTPQDGSDWVIAILVGFIVVLFVVGIGMLAACFVGEFAPQKHEAKQWNIIAANDSSATTGRFGLFSGYINSEFRYYYYYKDATGGIRLSWVPANSSQIFEDAPSGTGFVEEDDRVGYWSLWGYVIPDASTYKLHIPEGSVIQKYTMDLQ